MITAKKYNKSDDLKYLRKNMRFIKKDDLESSMQASQKIYSLWVHDVCIGVCGYIQDMNNRTLVWLVSTRDVVVYQLSFCKVVKNLIRNYKIDNPKRVLLSFVKIGQHYSATNERFIHFLGFKDLQTVKVPNGDTENAQFDSLKYYFRA